MTDTQVPARIGALWQQRMHSLREYAVVRDGNVFGSGFTNNALFTSEFDLARRHLDRLMAQYRESSFGEIFTGHEIENEAGRCFCTTSEADLPRIDFDIDRYRAALRSDLTLVRGIGKKTGQLLKERGYDTIEKLLHHPKFHRGAAPVMERLSNENSSGLVDLLGSRHPRSHPLALGAAGFHKPEDYVFIDIETMGFFSRPIILFGIGTIEQDRLVIRQYLLRDIAEEEAALVATMDHLSKANPALVTYNGRSFDLPYIADRLAYYGIPPQFRIPDFDLLHFSRRRWKDRLPSLRLTALEKEIFGIARVDDIPGQMVPEFYETYMSTGNCGPLVPIVEHNRQDLISLALLFCHLMGEWYGR
ncbi:MAG: ribonuclease H-like domain-containing protein [Methanoregula sp.]|nr:ribonuclease H-like domain-containing protein [Methanoregula sp.]